MKTTMMAVAIIIRTVQETMLAKIEFPVITATYHCLQPHHHQPHRCFCHATTAAAAISSNTTALNHHRHHVEVYLRYLIL